MYQTYETELIDYQYECILANGNRLSGNAQQLALKLHQEKEKLYQETGCFLVETMKALSINMPHLPSK